MEAKKNSKTKPNKNTTKTNNKKEKDIKKLEKQKKKEDKKKNRKHPKLWLTFKIIVIIILLLMLAGIAAFCAIFFSDKWSITKEQLLSDQGLTIAYLDGNEIITLTGDEISKKVELSEMGHIPESFIAIEDKRFYEHSGVDIIRTANAILNYGISVLTHKGASFGGSTITQQLVKITMNDDARSGFAGIERKIREWSRAIQVEKMLTKEQILARYLNRIYLGSSGGLEVRGVESAANYYFNKKATELDIAEAAFIAGINHSPNSYNPFEEGVDNSEKIKNRTLIVIDQMHSQGKINDEEYNVAKEKVNTGLTFTKGSVSNGNNLLSYHATAAINQVANELSEKEDISYSEAREIVINSGYTIYTTVNADIQAKLEEIYKNSAYQIKGWSGVKGADTTGQSAMAIIEPSTGYVVAEVGGLGENEDTLGLNRATSKRQGGSAFKPLGVVAPALENGVVTPATIFYDTKTTFAGNYTVKNDSERYYGTANMRTVLTKSLNVPEVKALSIMGVEKSQEFLKKIGIEVDASMMGLSMALGSANVSPLEMAAGFAMIANKGVYITPTFYTKVVGQDGNTVLEAKQEKTQVMSENNAYIATSLLTGPVKSGTASSYANFLGSMDVAGKTGTSDNSIDRWFAGFTPYYAGACWYGNDNGYQNKVSFGGTNMAAKIWFNAMKKVHSGLETKSFEKPGGIVSLKICKATGKKASSKCTDTYNEVFAKEHVPGECDGHEAIEICKETGKLATEFCEEKEKKYFGVILDTEKNANWSPKQEKVEAPTEVCDVHTKAPDVDVPNVIGKTEKEAKKELEKAGFKVKVLEDEDKNKKKDIVLKQSATKAAKGATITITVNTYKGKPSSNTSSGNTVGKNTVGNETSNTTKNNIATNTSVSDKD